MQIDLSQIQCFLAVAKELNFTRAAGELYLSQPVLSRKIASLEQELGVVLLVRDKRSVRLTAEGEAFRDLFGRHIGELNDLLLQIDQRQKQKTEHLRLGIFAGWDLTDFLHTMLFDFHIHYENVQIAFDTGSPMQLAQGLKNGQLDAVILLRVSADALCKIGILTHVEIDDLFSVEKCLVYSDKNSLADAVGLTIESFKNQPMLCLQNDSIPLAITTNQKFFASRGYEPTIQMIDTLDALSTELLAGRGYAILDDATRIFRYQGIRHIMLGDRHMICLIVAEHSRSATNLLREYLRVRYPSEK